MRSKGTTTIRVFIMIVLYFPLILFIGGDWPFEKFAPFVAVGGAEMIGGFILNGNVKVKGAF
jgi:hypothetical protein